MFTGFSFALSCVISASILKDLAVEQRPAEVVWFTVAGWLALKLMVFLGPLLVFTLPLHAARERALIEYGRMATRQHVNTHRKWTGHGSDDGDKADTSGLPSSSELNSSILAIREMGYTPINRAAVTQIVVAAGLPLVAVVFTLVPLDDFDQVGAGQDSVALKDGLAPSSLPTAKTHAPIRYPPAAACRLQHSVKQATEAVRSSPVAPTAFR